MLLFSLSTVCARLPHGRLTRAGTCSYGGSLVHPLKRLRSCLCTYSLSSRAYTAYDARYVCNAYSVRACFARGKLPLKRKRLACLRQIPRSGYWLCELSVWVETRSARPNHERLSSFALGFGVSCGCLGPSSCCGWTVSRVKWDWLLYRLLFIGKGLSLGPGRWDVEQCT